MTAGEPIVCPACSGHIKRGEQIVLRGLSYGHPACLPLEPRPALVRPFVGAR